MKLEFCKQPELSSDNVDVYTTSEETPITFCFVGPRGVGKTSLLASMYQQIKDNAVHDVFIDIQGSGNQTAAMLDESLQDMLDMIEDTDKFALVDLAVGLTGTQEKKEYRFVGESVVPDTDFIKWTDEKKFRFEFKFVDLPGQWYNPYSPDSDKAIHELENSFVSFLAIDTPALMKGPATCKRNNKANVIYDWYRKAADTLRENNHTVIIVLSRCEKYWNDRDAMLRKLEEVYGSMIEMLKDNYIDVYVTWIKTLGGVEFCHYEKSFDEKGNREDLARFIRIGDYEPENCATPLQLALEKGLIHAADKIETGILDRIGFDIHELAIKAAMSLAFKLKSKLHAGEDDTYEKL